jgi:hypothetical protein
MDPWAPCPDWRQLVPGTVAACLTCGLYPCLLFERRSDASRDPAQPVGEVIRYLVSAIDSGGNA